MSTTKCKICHNDSHCDSPLIRDKDEKVLCQMCRCDLCEKIYSRWVDDEDSYTDERIV